MPGEGEGRGTSGGLHPPPGLAGLSTCLSAEAVDFARKSGLHGRGVGERLIALESCSKTSPNVAHTISFVL